MPTNINEIEPMMCQDSISIQEDLAEAFDGQAILARMIPLKGQELEDEYKKDIGEIIGRALTKTNRTNLLQDKFLAIHSLPGVLYSVITQQEIPQDLWEKIRQCKELNNNLRLKTIVTRIETLSKNNSNTLSKSISQMLKEDKEDQELRVKYNEYWTREPSSKTNKNIMTQLYCCEKKYNQTNVVDCTTINSIMHNEELLGLLEFDKMELIRRMPPAKGEIKEIPPIALK